MSLGVISDFIYPIIVAVSVMTTFTTPFCIMAADPAYKIIRRLLPQRVNDWLDRYTEKISAPEPPRTGAIFCGNILRAC